MVKNGVVWVLAMLVFVYNLVLMAENANLKIMVKCFYNLPEERLDNDSSKGWGYGVWGWWWNGVQYRNLSQVNWASARVWIQKMHDEW